MTAASTAASSAAGTPLSSAAPAPPMSLQEPPSPARSASHIEGKVAEKVVDKLAKRDAPPSPARSAAPSEGQVAEKVDAEPAKDDPPPARAAAHIEGQGSEKVKGKRLKREVSAVPTFAAAAPAASAGEEVDEELLKWRALAEHGVDMKSPAGQKFGRDAEGGQSEEYKMLSSGRDKAKFRQRWAARIYELLEKKGRRHSHGLTRTPRAEGTCRRLPSAEPKATTTNHSWRRVVMLMCASSAVASGRK